MKQLIFIFAPILIIIIGLIFKKRQNTQNAVGGEISTPKALWLSYTIGSWFILPLIFFTLNTDTGLLNVFIFHLVSFYLRGIIELFMIYKYYNWSPVYGISHDIFHIAGIIILLNMYWPLEVSRATLLALFYIGSLVISTCFETIFSILFYKIRGRKKHKIYFASNSSEWKFVNKLTWFAVVVCFSLHVLNAYLAVELAL